MLHEVVGRESKALLVAPLGVEFDEVAGNVLDLGLGPLLEPLPRAGAEGAEPWRLARVRPAVLGYLVERVDRDIHLVVVLIDDAYHLLCASAGGRHLDEPAKLAYAEIDVDDVVAGLHLLQFLHRDGDLTRPRLVRPDAVLMEPVENLMVGEAANLHVVIDETLMNGAVDGDEWHGIVCGLIIAAAVHLVEDVAQTLLLLLAVGEDIDLVALKNIVGECLPQQLEVLVEQRLRLGVERDGALTLIGAERRQQALILAVADDGPLQTAETLSEKRGLAQHRLAAHLLTYLLLLELGGALHALRHGLRREALVVGALNDVVKIMIVLHHHQRVGGQEVGKWNFLRRELSQFGYNLDALLAVL